MVVENKTNFMLDTKKRTRYNKSVDILQQTCYQQADIRVCSHGLRQLVDDKPVVNLLLQSFRSVSSDLHQC